MNIKRDDTCQDRVICQGKMNKTRFNDIYNVELVYMGSTFVVVVSMDENHMTLKDLSLIFD